MWKDWVGRTIGGKYPLQGYLGGSDHSAVFLSVAQDGSGEAGPVAIKLIPADANDVDRQLRRWNQARELNHPNLLRILEAGREGEALLYVVQEYADENLAQVVPERALTADEVRGMMPPILAGLRFLHGKGFVHGHIQPSNILAIGDQVKLSADGLMKPGLKPVPNVPGAYDAPETAVGGLGPANDVWQLGVTLVEVMTQRRPIRNANAGAPQVPAEVGEPFGEIAKYCLQLDAARRWTIQEIEGRLAGRPVLRPAVGTAQIESPEEKGHAWKYAAALGLTGVLAAGVFLVVRPKAMPGDSHATTSPSESGQSAAETKGAGGDAGTVGGTEASAVHPGDEVTRRVLPEVSKGARRTIHGKIEVRVKVRVDAEGNVAKAKVESGRPSRYFKRVALEAAQDWKFIPVKRGEDPAAREWRLEFDFTRGGTEASAMRSRH
jgi:TonB family protein